jgi:hypothetical protein
MPHLLAGSEFRMNPFADLADRESEAVQTALTRTCRVCKARPKTDCHNPGRGDLNRIVHLERAQQHLDKRKKRP